jgi:2-polyprenyl-3-methyl-5-hydroxy-6-metoxy-1,4-benzoquinol methylase
METIDHIFFDKTKYTLYWRKGVFKPTATTNVLVEGVLKSVTDINDSFDILDLGSGTGIVAIKIAEKFKNSKIFASDLSQESTVVAKLNVQKYNLDIDMRHGSIFEPWIDKKFSIIIDDISGIAEGIAEASGWFDGVPCNSGIDGTNLTINVLREAKKHLSCNGLLFIPIISLSSEEKIMKEVKINYENYEVVNSYDWPMPKSLTDNIKTLENLKNLGCINYSAKFGTYFCNTKILKISGVKL